VVIITVSVAYSDVEKYPFMFYAAAIMMSNLGPGATPGHKEEPESLERTPPSNFSPSLPPSLSINKHVPLSRSVAALSLSSSLSLDLDLSLSLSINLSIYLSIY
jgi:hypothetical protein